MNFRASLRATAATLLVAGACGLAACGGGGTSGGLPHPPGPTPTPTTPPNVGAVQHIVVIVQENRTLDNLFQGFNAAYPGSNLDTQGYGYDLQGRKVQLSPVSFTANYDLNHSHGNFLGEYNKGGMNGWDRAKPSCVGATRCHGTAFGYVPPSETQPYFQLAHSFAIADHVFQSNQGPSFPAHQYLVAGQAGGFTSGYSEENNPKSHLRTGGCDVPGASIDTIDVATGGNGPFVFPCENYAPFTTILEEMDNAHPGGANWAYYVPSYSNIWNAPYGVQSIYNNPQDRPKVSQPETGIFNAVKAGTLAQLSYVIPCKANSDHASSQSATGPDWVASITNLIGQSKYWSSTVILITWDDWGGWFDHEKPPMRSAYEYGFRVPMIVVSPWLRSAGIVDHTQRDQTAILRFTETAFKLPQLGTLDRYSDDLTSMFDFSKQHKALPYRPINTHGFVYTNCSGSEGLDQEPVDD